MKIHWFVLAAAAVFIPAAAGIRSGHRIQASTPSPVQDSPTAAAPTRPSLLAQFSEALESWEDSSPAGGFMVSLNSDGAESVTVDIQGELLVCPKDDDHGPLVRVWIDWRRQALDALPESLRNDSDHQRAIDETYRQAIRGVLGENVAATYVPAELSIDFPNNRPPVGGYDIGGVGFTDIDEQAEVSNRDGGRTRDFWLELKKAAIDTLPEELREGSTYREAIETYFRASDPTYSVEQLEHWNQIAAEAAADRRAAQLALIGNR